MHHHVRREEDWKSPMLVAVLNLHRCMLAMWLKVLTLYSVKHSEHFFLPLTRIAQGNHSVNFDDKVPVSG